MKTHFTHTDGDTKITLDEPQPGVFEVNLVEGDQPLVQFTRTTVFASAVLRYAQAVTDECAQYQG